LISKIVIILKAFIDKLLNIPWQT